MTSMFPRQRGPAAEEITELWWVFLVMGAAVYALVIILLIVPMLRRRRRRRAATVQPSGDGELGPGDLDEVPARLATGWIVGLGVVLPLVVLVVALVLSVSTMEALPRTAPPGSVVIDVVGHQFWWSASYRDEQITVANEIHVPVGEEVELRLISADVIHSFWVPDLHGKLDVLPDGTNIMVIEADEAGSYGGECAEFCGLQHANMGLLVIAQPRDEFDLWVAAQQAPAVSAATEAAQRGQQLFLDENCGSCHTVRGVVTGDGSAPDLTHVASRSTLLSDTIENTTVGLTEFLRDPDEVKVGTGMPPPTLTEEELADVVAFLEGLS